MFLKTRKYINKKKCNFEKKNTFFWNLNYLLKIYILIIIKLDKKIQKVGKFIGVHNTNYEFDEISIYIPYHLISHYSNIKKIILLKKKKLPNKSLISRRVS
jgi:hypothetical protein